MNILTLDQLRANRISLNDVRRAVNLTLNNHQYDRRSDIPKKFFDKVSNICKQIEQAGIKYFVTENTYSYTIWEARHNASLPDSNGDETPIEQVTSSAVVPPARENQSAIGHNVFIREVINEVEQPKQTQENQEQGSNISPAKVRKYRGAIIDDRQKDIALQNNLKFTTTENGERKYRGAVIKSDNPVPIVEKKPKPSSGKKTVRKYRGAIIEE